MKSYLITGIKNDFKLLFLIFMEIFCYAQNGVNGAFWGQKLIILNFSQNLFIRFFRFF